MLLAEFHNYLQYTSVPCEEPVGRRSNEYHTCVRVPGLVTVIPPPTPTPHIDPHDRLNSNTSPIKR